ncbi:substrate-binding domain-containing protein [Dactylosporangium sp. AC04546]|uniref:VWA domain-containing protein n=1 Tax=Dactylosporangium sp. AC04546 TaxID=2862460 RepID=UPI001EDF0F01|nr:substrate-binding domain-containing protein [Dactylosporangium sp. AC04546]WVK83725.1 substrate-binding domain-containing protein [Dactylosporangium sp. AC04546]
MGAAAVAVLVVLAGSWYAFQKYSEPSCGNAAKLSIGAPADIVPALKAQAADWSAQAKLDDNCVDVEVFEADPADIAAAVAAKSQKSLTGVGQANGKTRIPDVWVPDSSLWLLRLKTANPQAVKGDAKSIARSPIVLAMPEPIATTFGWPQAKLSYVDLIKKVSTDQKIKVGIVDPSRDSTGLAALLTMAAAAQTAGGGNPTQATQIATAALRGLAAGRSSLKADLLQKFPRGSDATALSGGLSVAPLSEQTIIQYNAQQPPVRLAAVYAEPSAGSLDYPYVVLNSERAPVATELLKSLESQSFRDKLGAIGLRGADGAPGKGFQTPTNAPGTLAAGQLPDGAAVEALQQKWQAITLPARMLAVIDVSGSMLETVPTAGNATRMQVTLEAARKGMSLFDDSWALGVWTFSTQLDGAKDYKQLVPIGPLVSQRAACLQALQSITPKKTGDTALYDTILAGYKAVQQGWDSGRVNSLIVMTDGENDDPAGGLSLEQLIAELKKTADPAKPVQVILIGIGDKVGEAQMRQITDAIGGGTFVAPDPAKIGDIFLQAISLRGQVTQPK